MGWSRKKFYNRLLQKCLHENYILLQWTHNEGKPLVAERFIRILQGKIYKNDNKW